MKNNKKKKFALEQLKRIRKIATIIVVLIYLICFVAAIAGTIVEKVTQINMDKLVLFILITMFISLAFWMFFVDSNLGSKIREEKERIKISKIRKEAQKGELKNIIALKNESILNEILSNNIEKIVFLGKVNELLIVEIYLKNGYCLPTQLKTKEVLSILTQKARENILDNIVESITIEHLEETMVQVKINTEGYKFDERADDYNLLGWFELKK